MTAILRTIIIAVLMSISTIAVADKGGFRIEELDVKMHVNKNNSYDITETFTIFYEEPRHGFYRNLSNEFHITNLVRNEHTGEKENYEFTYVPKITDIDVPDYEFSTSEDNALIIKIGSEDKTVDGRHVYTIRYHYACPDDRVTESDLMFHSILGTGFDTGVDRLTFSISFEKALPDYVLQKKEGIIFSGEGLERSNSLGVRYEIDKGSIKGCVENIPANNAVSIFIPLPEGFWEGVPETSDGSIPIFLAILAIALSIVYIVLAMRNRKPDIVQTIEFYPPEGISSAEVGTIIDDSADLIDITSLIPWFAHKGYLEIREIPDKNGRSGKHADLELTLTKDLPTDAPAYQKKMIAALFKDKEKPVVLSELGDRSKQIEETISSLGKEFSGTKSLIHTDITIHLFWIIILIGIGAISTASVIEPVRYSMVLFAFLWAVSMLCILFIRWGLAASSYFSSKASHAMQFAAVAIFASVTSMCYILCLDDRESHLSTSLALAVINIPMIATSLCNRFVKDTDFRLNYIGRLRGFRDFINTAEKDRLQMLVDEDPSYFYDVLPYAIVFGLSDKWAEQFKDIDIRRPDWYESNSDFSNTLFISCMCHNLSSSATTSITSSSVSPSSSSAGGFAGGGSGGGGGGSW